MSEENESLKVALQSLRRSFAKPSHPPEYYYVFHLRSSHTYRIQQMRRWIRAMEKGLEETISKLKLQHEMEDYEWDELCHYEFGMSPEETEIDFYELEVPLLFYKWFVVSCYGQFEYALMETCKNFAKITGETFSPKDYKGSYIDKYKACFKKYLDLPFPDDIQAWQDMQTIRKLRNCIVHQLGRIEETRGEQQIRSLIRRVAADIPASDNRLLTTDWAGDGKPDTLVWKQLCHWTIATWSKFVSVLGNRLIDHYDLDLRRRPV